MPEVDSSSSARFCEVPAVEEMAMAASRSKGVLSASGKACKRRSRASNKPPITVLSADTTNFRAMVQKLTGIPPPQTFPPPSILQHQNRQFSPSSFSLCSNGQQQQQQQQQQSFFYGHHRPQAPAFNTAGFSANCFEQQQQQQIPVSTVPGSGFASMPGFWNAPPPPQRDDVSTSRGLMTMTSLMGARANPDYWLSPTDGIAPGHM